MSITAIVENGSVKLPAHVPDGTYVEITVPESNERVKSRVETLVNVTRSTWAWRTICPSILPPATTTIFTALLSTNETLFCRLVFLFRLVESP